MYRCHIVESFLFMSFLPSLSVLSFSIFTRLFEFILCWSLISIVSYLACLYHRTIYHSSLLYVTP